MLVKNNTFKNQSKYILDKLKGARLSALHAHREGTLSQFIKVKPGAAAEAAEEAASKEAAGAAGKAGESAGGGGGAKAGGEAKASGDAKAGGESAAGATEPPPETPT